MYVYVLSDVGKYISTHLSFLACKDELLLFFLILSFTQYKSFFAPDLTDSILWNLCASTSPQVSCCPVSWGSRIHGINAITLGQS